MPFDNEIFLDLVKNNDYELVLTLPKDVEFKSAEVVDSDVFCEAYIDDPDVDRYNTVKIKLKSPENKKSNGPYTINV